MNMLIWDVWTELVTQMCINLGQAFVAILVCCSIFLLHPLAAAIVCLNVLAVQFELMGPSSRTITSWSVLASTLERHRPAMVHSIAAVRALKSSLPATAGGKTMSACDRSKAQHHGLG